MTDVSGRSAPPQVRKDDEYLKWLSSKDQQTLCHSECAAAVREETKLIATVQAAITSHLQAVEHCRVASETDPDWFTLDVQDSHLRKVDALRKLLETLQADAPLPSEERQVSGTVAGRIFGGYARTAQATERLANRLFNSPDADRVQGASKSVRSAFTMVSNVVRGSTPHVAPEGEPGNARISDPTSPPGTLSRNSRDDTEAHPLPTAPMLAATGKATGIATGDSPHEVSQPISKEIRRAVSSAESNDRNLAPKASTNDACSTFARERDVDGEAKHLKITATVVANTVGMSSASGAVGSSANGACERDAAGEAHAPKVSEMDDALGNLNVDSGSTAGGPALAAGAFPVAVVVPSSEA